MCLIVEQPEQLTDWYELALATVPTEIIRPRAVPSVAIRNAWDDDEAEEEIDPVEDEDVDVEAVPVEPDEDADPFSDFDDNDFDDDFDDDFEEELDDDYEIEPDDSEMFPTADNDDDAILGPDAD